MTQKRYLGLDIMRALAISLVLLCHYSSPLYPFVSGFGERMFNIMNWLSGYFGVEIFFVLSGFLIGTIYLNTIQKSNDDIQKSLTIFIKRRWWRTLPNYYLFVVINIFIIVLLGGVLDVNAVVKAVFFLQKVVPEENVRFYGVSWSLAVEEWFYFLLPISFFVIISFVKSKKTATRASIFFLCLLPLVLKLIYISNHPILADHEEAFRYATFFRLDSIFAGVLYALLWKSENIQSRLLANKTKLLLVSIFLFLVSFAYSYLFLAKPIQNVLFYLFYTPINIIAIGLLLPYFMSLRIDNFAAKPVRAITFLSTTSYSIYLSHVPIKQICDYYLRPYFSEQSVLLSSLYIVLMLFFSFLFSFIIYQKFELKILQYRDRVLKESYN